MSRDGVTPIAPGELQPIRPEWEKLWREVPQASPFQSPAWVLSWVQVYAPDRCRAAALWRDGQLAAFVPAFVWNGALLLAGTGPSDHASALFAPRAESAAPDLLRALADSLAQPFNRIDLQQLAGSSPLLQIPVERYPMADATALGVAALARLGCGVADSPADAVGPWTPSAVFEPQISADDAGERLARFRAAEDALVALAAAPADKDA